MVVDKKGFSLLTPLHNIAKYRMVIYIQPSHDASVVRFV